MNSLPSSAKPAARRRGSGPRVSMFLRMLLRAAVLRKGRAAAALLAMTVAAATATAMLNLYVDVQAKLRKEFRNYGANVVVVARDGLSLPTAALQTANATLAGRGVAVPFGYVVARNAQGAAVVVAGTDFELVKKLNLWWSVTAWPKASNEALVGTRAATLLGQNADLNFQGRAIHVVQTGTVKTGAAEDSRVYLSLTDFEAWTGLWPSTIEIAASGSSEEIESAIQNLTQAMPYADVRPVRQILEGEARVLGKTRATLLTSAILIILTAALCVLATLTGWVFDRRRDFAVMKALGASDRLLNGFFAAEAALLGAVGAGLGFVIGIGIAGWIGRVNFRAPVVPRFEVLPIVFVGAVLVALLSAVVPISLLRRVQPATILRGE